MKPKTKKTLIIVAAIVVVAAIVYFAFFRKSISKALSIVDLLPITDEQKAAMKKKVAEIVANNANWSGWSRSEIERKAKEKGYTYDQWIVVEAAYALYYESDWALYDRIGLAAKSL